MNVGFGGCLRPCFGKHANTKLFFYWDECGEGFSIARRMGSFDGKLWVERNLGFDDQIGSGMPIFISADPWGGVCKEYFHHTALILRVFENFQQSWIWALFLLLGRNQ